MSRAYDAWTRFWHTPFDPRVAALVRILFGVLVSLLFALQYEFVEMYWGETGMVPYRTARNILDADASSLLFFFPKADWFLWLMWSLAVVQGLLLAVGWKPQIQAAFLYVWLVSFQHRNIAVVDGEDGMFRLICFFLIFAHTSDVWSVDAWQRKKADKPRPKPKSGWAMRFIQLQVCFVFFVAGLEKLPGNDWHQGFALHYIMQLDDLYGRFWVPEAIERSLLASQVMSWGTLVLEMLIPFAVWFKPTRRLAIVLAIGFHLALEYMMNLYLFEWVMITCWLAFLDWDRDVAPWLNRLRPKTSETEAAAA